MLEKSKIKSKQIEIVNAVGKNRSRTVFSSLFAIETDSKAKKLKTVAIIDACGIMKLKIELKAMV